MARRLWNAPYHFTVGESVKVVHPDWFRGLTYVQVTGRVRGVKTNLYYCQYGDRRMVYLEAELDKLTPFGLITQEGA